MATSYTSNKKIGALDSASTPLAAANEIVLNQNGDIVKAALSDVEAKVFDAKTAKTTVDGTEVVVVRQTDNSLRQVPLDNIVKAGLITNAMVSNSAAIADSKLDTINTAGKVTNTAVQAVSTNTANRIVTRDGSGNFAAGTVTATLSGNATTATTLATGRTIALTGDVTGTTGSFNGSANVSAATTIANNAVTTAKIADGNVTTAKIANDSVDNTKLRNSAALSVIGRSANSTGDPADIAAGTDGHVLRRSGTGLGFGQVVSAGIATGAVTATELASNAVTTVKILDANVTTAKIADSNVTTAKSADANVTDAKLATGAVTGAAGGGKIAASAITGQTQLADPLASGDEFLVHDTSASALRRVAFNAMQPAGSVLNTVQSENTTLTACSTAIPDDNTIPQNNEGTEVLTATITPSSTSNKILVRVCLQGNGPRDSYIGAAIFTDSNANAIAATFVNSWRGMVPMQPIEYLHSPNTTSAITYKVRAGALGSGTFYLNGDYLGNAKFGGTMRSTLTLQEIKG